MCWSAAALLPLATIYRPEYVRTTLQQVRELRKAGTARTEIVLRGGRAVSFEFSPEGLSQALDKLGVGYDARIVSAHRTPQRLVDFAQGAAEAGFKVIIAGAGGAAHLPGMIAAKTVVPVLGVPVQTKALSGVDSLHSIVQMPKGVPVATFAIGQAGAANAALFAVAMLANQDAALRGKLEAFRAEQTAMARAMTLPPVESK